MEKKDAKSAPPQSGSMNTQEWVDYIFRRAVEMRASDIHVDPRANTFAVRCRIDGVLRQLEEQPRERHASVVSRLKILANLDITETRKPQSGHMVLAYAELMGKPIDIRVSVFPTIFGEAVALRLLNRRDYLFENFAQMGMEQKDAQRLDDAIRKPHGMVLATGPSGAGKTTTLYTALAQLQSVEKNIVTLEDPVEYQLELVRHAQINPDVGFSFSEGLRAALRQDPDILMIGEIRDNESAEIAVRAAMAGRLLFSTMHTNDSVGAVMRFLEFGMPRSFIANALRAVVAQRLVRLNCPNCTDSYVPSEGILQNATILANDAGIFRRGKGCPACYETGFSGRQGIFELFIADREIELLILEGASYRELWQAARDKGENTLREQAIQLAREGKTTLEEAIHMTA